MQAVPAAVRMWFNGVSQPALTAALELYTTEVEAPLLIKQEAQAARALAARDMVVTASGKGQEIVAAIEVDEDASLELAIRMPPSYPLHPAEVRTSLV